jgi:D-inositol-3-phosphate glycosyltransferase
MNLYYKASDIFVSLPDNIQESFGLTVVEAMASALPCVISDWSGYRDLIEDGVSGYLIPTLWKSCDDDLSRVGIYNDRIIDHAILAQSVVVNIAPLTRILIRLINDSELRANIGQEGRGRAIRCFSFHVIAKAHSRLRADMASMQPISLVADTRVLSPKYTEHFGHFASREIASSALMRLTDREVDYKLAVLMLEGPVATPKEAVVGAMNLLLAQGEMSFAALSFQVQFSHKLSDAQSKRLVLLLLKYDIAELADGRVVSFR